ncbi:MAG: hypothetical protein AB7S26_36325 [Sandaracinaceae bacterium]
MEDPDCWRRQLPVQPCDDPVSPELIGLWGIDRDEFEGRILYDGCCVTFTEVGTLRMTLTFAMMRESLMNGRPANVGRANRTQATWDGDRLGTDSHLGRFVVARRDEQDRESLIEVDMEGAERPLVRFDGSSCVNEPTRDVLCAQRLVAEAESTPTVGVCRP